MELDKNGSIERNFDRPIKKDNIQVPTGGYAVIRFKAENPGKYTQQFMANTVKNRYKLHIFDLYG